MIAFAPLILFAPGHAQAADYYRGVDYSVTTENNETHTHQSHKFGLPTWHYSDNGTYVPFEFSNNVLKTGDYYATFNGADCTVTYTYTDKSTLRELIRVFITAPDPDVIVPADCDIQFDKDSRTVKIIDDQLEWQLELQNDNALKSTYIFTNNKDVEIIANPELHLISSEEITRSDGSPAAGQYVKSDLIDDPIFVLGDYIYDYTDAINVTGSIDVDKYSLRILYNNHNRTLAPFEQLIIDPTFDTFSTFFYVGFRPVNIQFNCNLVNSYSSTSSGNTMNLESDLDRCTYPHWRFDISSLGTLHESQITGLALNGSVSNSLNVISKSCWIWGYPTSVGGLPSMVPYILAQTANTRYAVLGDQCFNLGTQFTPFAVNLTGPAKGDLVTALQGDTTFNMFVRYPSNNEGERLYAFFNSAATLTVNTTRLLISPVQSLNATGEPGNWQLEWRPGLPGAEVQNYTVQHWNINAQEWRDIGTTDDTSFTTDSFTRYLRVVNQFANYTNAIIATEPTPELRFDFQNTTISSGLNASRLAATTENYETVQINNFTLTAYSIPDANASSYIMDVPDADVEYWRDLIDDDEPFTLMFWVNPGSGYEPWFQGYDGTSRSHRIDATRLGADNQLIRIEWQGSEINLGGIINYPALSYDNWQHIALVYDGASQNFRDMRFYINGSLVPISTNQIWGSSTADSFAVGGEPQSPNTACDDCQFVDFMIFTRQLTGPEITDIVNMSVAPPLPIPPPGAVDLTFGALSFTSVDLDWTQPASEAPIIGYQINQSTPWGPALTIIENNTGSPVTEYTVTGLAPDTQYSFSVAARTDTAIGPPSERLDITTLANVSSIIDLPVNVTNPQQIDIRYARQNIVGTNNTLVSVSYPTGYLLNCELSYRFTGERQFYPGPPRTELPGGRAESVFQLNDYENDIVTFNCFNAHDPAQSARYVVTHENVNIPLIDQINNFRDGQYGTAGVIGTLDIVGVAAVVIAQIGLNRKNEGAGVVIAGLVLGALGFFGIITVPALITGAVVVAILFGVTTTRKD